APGTNQARRRKRRRALKLPLLGSNQDSPDPESGVLPVTPRGTVRTGQISRCAALTQLPEPPPQATIEVESSMAESSPDTPDDPANQLASASVATGQS